MIKLKPTKEELAAAINKTVPDVIKPDLKVLFCGINPGLYTAAIGHHFGRPGNRFWRALYESGFTPRLFDPSEENELLDIGYGITNLVFRATLSADEVSKSEILSGAEVLKQKVLKYQPKWLAVVGIQAYRIAFNQPKAIIGKQKEKNRSTRIWVLPNPSGSNAHYPPPELAIVFENLRLAMDK